MRRGALGLGTLLALGVFAFLLPRAGSPLPATPPTSRPPVTREPARPEPLVPTPTPTPSPRAEPPTPEAVLTPPAPPPSDPAAARDTGWLPHRDPRPFSRQAIGEALQEAVPVWERCWSASEFTDNVGQLTIEFQVAPGADGVAEIQNADVTGDVPSMMLKGCVLSVVNEFRFTSPPRAQGVRKTLTFRPPTDAP